jgi:hypothetical protein
MAWLVSCGRSSGLALANGITIMVGVGRDLARDSARGNMNWSSISHVAYYYTGLYGLIQDKSEYMG